MWISEKDMEKVLEVVFKIPHHWSEEEKTLYLKMGEYYHAIVRLNKNNNRWQLLNATKEIKQWQITFT